MKKTQDEGEEREGENDGIGRESKNVEDGNEEKEKKNKEVTIGTAAQPINGCRTRNPGQNIKGGRLYC